MLKPDEIVAQAKEYYHKCNSLEGFKNTYELLDKNNPDQALMRFLWNIFRI